MHWLAEQVSRVSSLVPEGRHGDAEHAREQRKAFLDAVGHVVEEVARRPGVTGAFASYEGLIVAHAGNADFEGLAAMAQSAMEPAQHAAGMGHLGALQQVVIVGDRQKIALIRLGPVSLGILSASAVALANATAV